MPEEKVWRPLDLVKVTTGYLAGKQVPNPRLDAEVLLCHVLGLKRRVDLYAGFEQTVSPEALARYRDVTRRRAAREPVSRILGSREFMGLSFIVTPDVLSPRPETEQLVEAALEVIRPRRRQDAPPPEADDTAADADAGDSDQLAAENLARILDSYSRDADNPDGDDGDAAPPPAPVRRPAAAAAKRGTRPVRNAGDTGPEVRVLDLGTGSGCIAVSLAAHCPRAIVTAVDASPKALAVAKKNAKNAGVGERVVFRQGDWFAGCPAGEKYHAILSNPPYLIPGDAGIWPEVAQYDPPLALYGGADGLDCYRRIIPDAPLRLAADGWLFLEVGEGQGAGVGDMLRRRGFREVEVLADYGGVQRIVKARAPE